MFDEPGNELLLHICRPKKESLGTDNNRAATMPSANSTLTPREIEVLTLLAGGESTCSIASIMCVSTTTVRNHIQHVLDKLHVHTRLEAVMRGKRLDMI
jgi:DNA-binding NarL/FixJ family response regulator